jgi:membrane-associated phospholipid phosphatase
VHWASDALAGALIGYAVGKTVGKSFKQLLEKPGNKDNFLFYTTPNGMGVVIRL